MKKSARKKANRKGFFILMIVLLVAIVVVVGVILADNKKKSDPKPQGSGTIEPTSKAKEDKITNFLIFGVDDVGYTPADKDRSDTIMIVSINEDQNAVKIISILRDAKVPIKGVEPQKINYAYKLGGAPLAIDTINDNFHLKLRNYITLNFAGMENLVDMIGGIDIELTQQEADIVNEQNPESEYVYEGENHLDGPQALTYSRIRMIDSDYGRANRQQNVMNAILHQLRVKGTAASLGMLDSFMETVETSYFYTDLYNILSPLDMSTLSLSRYFIPDPDADPEVIGGIDESTGNWVWQFDIEKAAGQINELLSWE